MEDTSMHVRVRRLQVAWLLVGLTLAGAACVWEPGQQQTPAAQESASPTQTDLPVTTVTVTQPTVSTPMLPTSTTAATLSPPTSTASPTALPPTPTAGPATRAVTSTPTAEPGSAGHIVFKSGNGDLFMVDALCARAALGCDTGWIKLTNVRADVRAGRTPIRISAEDGLTASPDGKRIAFVAVLGEPPLENYDIYVLDVDACSRMADGCRQDQWVRLTTDLSDDKFPAWSPDGQLIAYTSNRGPGASPARRVVQAETLYTMRPDGSEQQRLLARDVAGFPSVNIMPTWSPDSQQLAFIVMRLTSPPGAQAVYTVRCDGSGLRQLAASVPTPTAPSPFLRGAVIYADVSSPRWSPDGKYIMVSATRVEAEDAYLLDAWGTNVRRLTGSLSRPAWSFDGQKVIYIKAGEGALYVMSVDGSSQMQLTSRMPVSHPIWIQ